MTKSPTSPRIFKISMVPNTTDGTKQERLTTKIVPTYFIQQAIKVRFFDEIIFVQELR